MVTAFLDNEIMMEIMKKKSKKGKKKRLRKKCCTAKFFHNYYDDVTYKRGYRYLIKVAVRFPRAGR